MLMKKLTKVSAMFALCGFFMLTMLTSVGSVHAQDLQGHNVSSITISNPGPYGPDTCKQGYVWREAIPSDHVCVTPDQRTRVAQDNAAAVSRRNPTGPYGSDTCVQGYVWREAFTNDHVCVTPDERSRAAYDNSQAANRVAR
ncbi:hypothetical protein [Dictyobacter halimunensis]|uniref:hypothetical protein n=1 Tax=Dictyobacter halimunensis TaxID=3026934 RepID=UPI0030C6F8F6